MIRSPSPAPLAASTLLLTVLPCVLAARAAPPPGGAPAAILGAANGPRLERVSRALDGGRAIGPARGDSPAISADGRYVAFASDAEDFAAVRLGVTNVFLRDRTTWTTFLASAPPAGGTADGASFAPAVSADGRFVAFLSWASNLVPGDTNGEVDVFLYDRQSGGVSLASAAPGGAPAAGSSWQCALSGDGRWVAFQSDAANLVAGDTNDYPDVFVRDRVAGTTTLVSAAPGGGPADGTSSDPSVSADGRCVAFRSWAANLAPGDANGTADVFVRERLTGTVTLESAGAGGQGDGESGDPSISGDGRYLAFASTADNLAPGDTNGTEDVFLRDRITGAVALVSAAADGGPAGGASSGAAVSGDGRFVAFHSWAHDIAPGDTFGELDVFVRDMAAGTTARAGGLPGGPHSSHFAPALSGDGALLCYGFHARSDGRSGILLRRRAEGSVERADVGPDGQPGSAGAESVRPAISADGRCVAFQSTARNLAPGDTNEAADVFVRDRLTGQTALASAAPGGAPADDASFSPAISGDGRWVAFASDAANLVPGDTNGLTDVFLHDRQAGTTALVSAAAGGGPAWGRSFAPAVSDDGRFVAFESWAGNLLPGGNPGQGIFVRDLLAGTTMMASTPAAGAFASGSSHRPDISGDGRLVVFQSWAGNLVPGDANGTADVFVRDMLAGSTTLLSAAGGVQGNGPSFTPAISRDGSAAAFESLAANLVSGDTNGTFDVFARSIAGGAVVLVSAAPAGAANGASAAPAIGRDGSRIAFQSSAWNLATGDTGGWRHVYLRDAAAGTTTLASPAPSGVPAAGESERPAISDDGGVVAFQSWAPDLVPDGLHGARDVYAAETRRAYTVSGRVTNAGVGLGGVTVRAGAASAVTDADGTYVIEGLAPGTHRLVPEKAEYVFNPPEREVSVGPDRTGVDFGAGPRTYAIGGRVHYRGSGLPGAVVAAGSVETVTDAGGEYLLQGLPAGTWTVTAAPAGLSLAPRTVELGPSRSGVDFAAALPRSGRLRADAAIDFGRVRPGGARDRPLALRNASRDDTLWMWIPGPPEPFAAAGGGLIAIPPGGARAVVLRFSPPRRGAFRGVLALESSDPARPAAPVRLRGRGG